MGEGEHAAGAVAVVVEQAEAAGGGAGGGEGEQGRRGVVGVEDVDGVSGRRERGRWPNKGLQKPRSCYLPMRGGNVITIWRIWQPTSWLRAEVWRSCRLY